MTWSGASGKRVASWNSPSGQILLLRDGQNDCGSTQEAGESLRRSTLPVRIDAVGFGLEEGGQAENDLGDLVRASGNGQQYFANSAGELISAFRRAFIADQVKTDDPTLTGPAAARLSELFAVALDYLRADDVRSARLTFEQALAQFPDAPAAHFNASLAYEAEGQVVSAIEHGEAYLRL